MREDIGKTLNVALNASDSKITEAPMKTNTIQTR